MNLKKALILCAIALMPVVASADMTDQQIMSYLVEQQSKGTSQEEILQHLVKQGVTPQRLMQLKQKYGSISSTSKSGVQTSSDRRRSNNGETKNTPNGPKGQTRLMGSVGKTGQNAKQGTDYISMQNALSGLMPDTTSMYPFEYEMEQGPKVFGRDVFRNENITFEPNANIATPANYILGVGDQIYIDIYGNSQASIEGIISPDGFIVVDGYGPLQLAGMTVEQASQRAKQKLRSIYSNSSIRLSVGQTRTIQVNVMGEVMVPGTYTLSAFSSVFHALYCAGGVSDIGSLRTVKLYRDNTLVNTIDIYDYILNGNLSGDIRLQDNDVIVVPTYEALVSIAGKAKRPMAYEMKSTETIGKALEYAGGFASDAYTKSMRLQRKSGGNLQVYNIDSSNMDSFLIADGDSLSIDSLVARYENMVDLQGAVFHPGMYQLGDQTSSVRRLLEYADGVNEDAFLSHAILYRMRKDRTQEVISLDLKAILDGSVSDVELQNEDVIFVPNTQEAKEDLTYTIRGEVYAPGIYQFAYNTTLGDLILQAGGLNESASLNKISVARRNKKSDQGIEIFTFDLNEDLSLQGGKTFTLEPYDEVMVKRTEGYRDQETVSIEGEVYFQGEFSLPKGNTRISELVGMAGGMTEQAAENGVYVLRQMDEEELRLRQNRLDSRRYSNAYNSSSRASQMQTLDIMPITDSLLVVRDTRENIYKVAVDIRKALKKPGCDEDLVLRNGDRIIVEAQKNTVTLSGSFAYSGTVPYVEGKNIKFYMRQGGVRPSARNRRMTYVIAQNGQAYSYRSWKKVEAGSEVCLREFTSELTTAQKVSIWASLASTLATAGAVIVSVLK